MNVVLTFSKRSLHLKKRRHGRSCRVCVGLCESNRNTWKCDTVRSFGRTLTTEGETYIHNWGWDTLTTEGKIYTHNRRRDIHSQLKARYTTEGETHTQLKLMVKWGTSSSTTLRSNLLVVVAVFSTVQLLNCLKCIRPNCSNFEWLSFSNSPGCTIQISNSCDLKIQPIQHSLSLSLSLTHTHTHTHTQKFWQSPRQEG